ncbi:hypothetical protein Q8A73_008622 [Channa argus]|nr:hypothetical protein Q8A73_008622 [Channa argus]
MGTQGILVTQACLYQTLIHSCQTRIHSPGLVSSACHQAKALKVGGPTYRRRCVRSFSPESLRRDRDEERNSSFIYLFSALTRLIHLSFGHDGARAQLLMLLVGLKGSGLLNGLTPFYPGPQAMCAASLCRE